MKKYNEKEVEDETGLQEELMRLVHVLTESNEENEDFEKSLEHLGRLIKTSTSSMTAVPKPLKYLKGSYEALRSTFEKAKLRKVALTGSDIGNKLLKDFADILSVLSLASTNLASRECLKYCLEGTAGNPGDWGHEYVRQLETDIVEEILTSPVEREEEIKERLMPLVESIVKFDIKHNAEIQACDLCLEIDQLSVVEEQLDETNFVRICNYLSNCASYSEESERDRILKRIIVHCLRFGDYSRAMIIALELNDPALIEKCLNDCKDVSTRRQLAFILARQKRSYPEISMVSKDTTEERRSERAEGDGKTDESNEKSSGEEKKVEGDLENLSDEEMNSKEKKIIEMILSNCLMNSHFQILARELDILEAKLPEEIYKSWLVTGAPTRHLIVNYDSARANLAASFVTGFVHAGFGLDKLLSSIEVAWVYKNKDHGMLSATAALGLIHMWDVDGGLVPIDKYLYSGDDYVKSGALLAIGIVNCGVRNECDPAMALLPDYLLSASQTLRIGAVMGLGIAHAGTQRRDVSDLLSSVLQDKDSSLEVAALSAISLALTNVGSGHPEMATLILQKMLELPSTDLTITHARFLPLALGIIYMGRRDDIETVSTALEVLPDPYKLAAQTMLQVCSYAGTGDVLVVRELLQICSEPTFDGFDPEIRRTASLDVPSSVGDDDDGDLSDYIKKPRTESSPASMPFHDKSPDSDKSGSCWDTGPAQAVAVLGLSVVALPDGKENSRIFGQIGRYGTAFSRRAVPLAMALSSLSDPDCALVDVLNKYSHDNDLNVVRSAILALGLVGAGTNNARLAAMLRQLAAYHAKDPSNLFLVRISEGLVHLGKGTMSLSPLRYDRKVIDYTALAALLVVSVACLDCENLILGKSHFLLYWLSLAIEPRWLVTVNTNFQPLPVSVRIGEAVDVVGKVGNPKVLKGGRVQTTPLLLAAGERAELVDERYQPLSNVLEGFVVLREQI